MKKITLILAAALTLLTACHSDDDTTPTTAEVGRITFEVVNYQQYSMDDPTRAETLPVDELAHLDLAVYKTESNALILQQHQKKGDEGYGTFSASLPYGSYNVVMLGYQGSREAIIDDITAICYKDDYVPDFFYDKKTITVDKPETEAKDVVLKRAVACFNLISSGKNPSNLKSISFTSHGGSHHFNALTGMGSKVESRTYSFDATKYAAADTLNFGFFTFLTSLETTMNFTVTAKDSEGNVLRTRDFNNNVPMKINQRTQYKGWFFAPETGASGYTFLLDGNKWNDVPYTY